MTNWGYRTKDLGGMTWSSIQASFMSGCCPTTQSEVLPTTRSRICFGENTLEALTLFDTNVFSLAGEVSINSHAECRDVLMG